MWLAIQFKRTEKCKLHKPEWLSTDALDRVLVAEKQDLILQHLPFHYMEVAQVIMRIFRDEFMEPDKILSILEDIENVRMDRLRLGMNNMRKDTVAGIHLHQSKLRNASAMELLGTKNFCSGSLTTFDAFYSTDLLDVQQSALTESGTGAASRKLRRHR